MFYHVEIVHQGVLPVLMTSPFVGAERFGRTHGQIFQQSMTYDFLIFTSVSKTEVKAIGMDHTTGKVVHKNFKVSGRILIF